MKTESKGLDYNVGAVAVIVISIGVAAMVYGLQLIPFDLINIFAWILGPWGVFTVVYSFTSSKDMTYYLVWGTIMVAVGVIAASYSWMNIFIALGILVVVLAVIGVLAYWRSRK
jgi:hypothetical protein